MTRRAASKFRQREVTRALRAAGKAGVKVDSVEIDPSSGKIVVRILGSGDDDPKQVNTADAVLERLKKHEHGKS